MTNEQLLDDLKQFVAATVSQSEQRIRAEMATKDDFAEVEQRLARVEQRLTAKVDEAQQNIGDAIQVLHDEIDTQFKDHDKRIHRLEHKVA
jgi:hypothetical protein